MSNKKILIIHDRFKYRGGGERLVLIMAKGLNANIATEYWSEEESFSKSEAPAEIFILGRQIEHAGLSYFSAQWRFFWKTKFIKDYDTIIFSGNNCLSAAWRCRKNQRKIMYCHTPVRYAYDLKDYYLKQKTWWKKPLFLFFVLIARIIYQWGIKKMDLVLANSKNVQNRLEKYCGIKSTVVNPPIISFCHSESAKLADEESVRENTNIQIDSSSSRFATLRGTLQDDNKKENYYLSFGRLDKLKRIDDIVRAFQKMPNKKLIVASGGPELEKIKKLAEGHDNIKILGFVSDQKLAELIGNCIASIYIPIDEDFGMTPLEAAAAGKPTVGVDDGGLKETIIHQQTGYLLPKDYKIEDLIKAVQWLSPVRAGEMGKSCLEQAKKFNNDRFVVEIRSVL